MSWRCGDTWPSSSMCECVTVFAVAHLAASVVNAPFGPMIKRQCAQLLRILNLQFVRGDFFDGWQGTKCASIN
jgi:hypothetical protein